MTKFQTLCAALAVAFAAPVFAHDGVHIEDPYARATGMSGAVFLVVDNHQIEDDRLIGVASDVAQKVELHTHKESADGVMQMVHVPEGVVIPAMAKHALARGGDHIMLMGLTRDLKEGDVFSLTLTFERAGEVTIDVAVANDRKPDSGAGHDKMKHMNHDSTATPPSN